MIAQKQSQKTLQGKLLNQILTDYKNLIDTLQEGLGVIFESEPTKAAYSTEQLPSITEMLVTDDTKANTKANTKAESKTKLKTKSKAAPISQGMLTFSDGGTSNADEIILNDLSVLAEDIHVLTPYKAYIKIEEEIPVSGNNPFSASWVAEISGWRSLLLKVLAAVDNLPGAPVQLEDLRFPTKLTKKGSARREAIGPFHLVDPKVKTSIKLTASGKSMIMLRCMDDVVLAFPTVFVFNGYHYAFSNSHSSKRKIGIIRLLIAALEDRGVTLTVNVKH